MKKAQLIEEYAQAVAKRVDADSIDTLLQTLQQWRRSRVVRYRTAFDIRHEDRD